MPVSIYLDGASIDSIRKYADNKRIAGFTTNPSLMKKAGITDYRAFGREVLDAVNGKPVSFEVMSDDFAEMERQAREIQGWGSNIYIKIPITDSKGQSSVPLISRLQDCNLNVTAVFTHEQIDDVTPLLKMTDVLSIFAGRITDTGRNPPVADRGRCKWLWASCREVYSYYRAAHFEYDIITMTPDLVEKLFALEGKDLTQYSLETVQMFVNDGKGLTL